MSFYNDNNEDYENSCPPRRFATGGGDNKIKIWKYEGSEIIEEQELKDHTEWIRDVSWLKFLGSRYETIATCSEDCFLYIYQNTGSWEKVFKNKFDFPIVGLSWSNCGSYLAASCGDNQILILSQNISGKWEILNKIDESGNISNEVLC